MTLPSCRGNKYKEMEKCWRRNKTKLLCSWTGFDYCGVNTVGLCCFNVSGIKLSIFRVCFMWLHLTIFVVNFNTCGWAWRSCCFHQVLPASGRRLQHCGAAWKCFYAQQAQSWKIKEKLDLVRSEKIWFRRSKQIVFLKVISIDSRHIRKYFAKVLDQNSKIRACNLET